MAFKREKIDEYFLLDTGVENIFINEHMASAPGDYVKVYMLALMYADLNVDISNEEIARHLSIDHEDVLKAWTFWEKHGVIRKIKNNPNDKFDYDVEFITLKEQLYGEKTVRKPFMSEDSSQAVMADKEIQDMFGRIEKITGNVLSSTVMMEIISCINDYDLTPELVVYGYDYCVKKGHKNFQYVSAVLKSWAEEGMRDVETVEEYLSKQDKQETLYKRVFKALGFARNATEEERHIMDTWFDTMGFALDDVLSACKKTVGISNPNIKYVNAILVNQYEEQGAGKSAGTQAGGDPTTSEIFTYYEKLRAKEAEEAQEHRSAVYGKIPRIKEIEEEVSAQNAELSKLIISDRPDRKKMMEAARGKMEELNAEKAFLLTDNGFEMDFMDIRYRCPQCKDTGILETGEKCQCFREVTREKINLISK